MKNLLPSLPARIVFIVFAATLVTSLTVTAVSISSIDSFLRGRIGERFPEALNHIEDGLQSWYEQRHHELGVFSRSEVLRDALTSLALGTQMGCDHSSSDCPAADTHDLDRARSVAERDLSYVLNRFPNYAALFAVDTTGRELVWVGDHVEIEHAALSAKNAGLRDDATDAVVWPVDAPSLQAIASRDIVSGDKHLGTLYALVRLSALHEVLPRQDLGSSGRIHVIDRDGRLLVSTQHHEAGAPYTGPRPSQQDVPLLTDYVNEAGERWVGGTRRLRDFGWTVVVEQQRGEAFALVMSAIGRVVGINLVIVVLMGFAAFRVAASIVRPIEALSDAAHRISEGERGVAIPETNSSDEVGVLTRAFKDMTTRLTNKAAELQESHRLVEETNGRLQMQNEELQNVNEVLEQLSITDGLTKLHNHRYFQEVLMHECKRASRSSKPLSLVLIDIDHFKYWNDRLGHAAGDEILRRMANVMDELIRETDLLARYGGEEFALLLPNTDTQGATSLAEKIRSEIAETEFFIGPPGERDRVTVSIGVASYRADRRALFNEADRALYRAKSAGRDCVVTAEEEG